ncbi:acid-sensing ion channel 1C-like [Antedon mediterranea]|uniref:acid-sensing ion channel 1C-like n=1 Tax=Antedon mediterranea TaxID=105859 RepID=UPI003AF75A41
MNTVERNLPNEGETTDKSEYFKDVVGRFGEETTLHGVNHIVTKKSHFIQRCAWFIFLAGAISLLGVYAFENILYFFSRPMSTTIAIKQLDELEFPSVTFCNYNHARLSVTTPNELSMLGSFFGLVEDGIDIFTADFSEINTTIVAEDLIRKTAHTVEGAVELCTWELYEECGPLNFTTVMTDFGVCYTFNHKSNPRRLMVQKSGKSRGLYLRLNIEQHEYTHGANSAAGFKMLVHTKGERPLISQFGFALGPGYETLVAFRKILYKSLKKPYPSECVDEGIKYSDVYTQSLCEEECIADVLYEKCGCRHTFYPGYSDQKNCTVEEAVECVVPEAEKIVQTNTHCKCRIGCQYKEYSTKVSSALWPGDHFLEHLEHHLNKSTETIKKNYLDVYLYYEDISYEFVEQVPAYSPIKLLCDIGGLMGLLCGMSVMTIIEIVEFVCMSFGKCLPKGKKVGDVVT